MSRSYKKAIYKDNTGKKTYWRRIRSRWKNLMRSGADPEQLPSEKTIVNDWDYCDYITDYEYNFGIYDNQQNKEKLKRK